MEAGVFLIKPNLTELAALVGKEIINSGQVEQASKELICSCKCEVIITSLGAEGAMLVTSDTTLHVIPPQVNIQCTIGTGDSMLAGIIMGLFNWKSIIESAQYGVTCGTAATSNPGTELCHLADVAGLYNTMRNAYTV